MNNNHEIDKKTVLLDEIDFDCLGVIWISKESFFEVSEPLAILDYLLDGLMVQHCNYLKDEKNLARRVHLFTSTNANATFFVGHVHYSSKLILEDLLSLTNIFTQHLAEKKKGKVVILDSLKDNDTAKLFEKLKEQLIDIDLRIIKYDKIS